MTFHRCHSERKYPVVKGHKCPELQGYKRRASTAQKRFLACAALQVTNRFFDGLTAEIDYAMWL